MRMLCCVDFIEGSLDRRVLAGLVFVVVTVVSVCISVCLSLSEGCLSLITCGDDSFVILLTGTSLSCVSRAHEIIRPSVHESSAAGLFLHPVQC